MSGRSRVRQREFAPIFHNTSYLIAARMTRAVSSEYRQSIHGTLPTESHALATCARTPALPTTKAGIMNSEQRFDLLFSCKFCGHDNHLAVATVSLREDHLVSCTVCGAAVGTIAELKLPRAAELPKLAAA